MYNGNGRPLSKKKTIQLMVALTILAWATQTLRHQWGFGAEVHPQPTAAGPVDAAPAAAAPSGDADDALSQEKFVPGSARFSAGVNLEMRTEAAIVGNEIKLKQVCRWSEGDKAIFAPVADFVLARLSPGAAFRTITITEIKSTLTDAGVNLAAINFVGATSCTVARTDVQFDEHSALEQWINARQGTDVATAAATQPAATQRTDPWADALSQGITVTSTTSPAPATKPSTEQKQYHALRELLTNDLATRTGIPVERLQMAYREQDEKVLSLTEPHFRFQIDPIRARDLGEVSWSVTILAQGSSQRVTVNAEARAWQQEIVVNRALASRQMIRDEDVIERRTLVDRLPNEPLLSRDQLVNQQASRDLKAGDVMSSRMVDPIPMVKAGQFVTITITQGAVQIKTVARAMESGSFGQSIRVKNETTRDLFQVTITGPQAATMDAAPAGVAASGQ